MYTVAYNWILLLLQQTSDSITYDSISLFIDSAYLDITSKNPAISIPVDDLSANDAACLYEAMGCQCASRIIMLPPEEGVQIVTRIKVANLEEAYKVPDLAALSQMWQDQAIAALQNAPLIQAQIAGTTGSPLLPGMISGANPTQAFAVSQGAPPRTLWANIYVQRQDLL